MQTLKLPFCASASALDVCNGKTRHWMRGCTRPFLLFFCCITRKPREESHTKSMSLKYQPAHSLEVVDLRSADVSPAFRFQHAALLISKVVSKVARLTLAESTSGYSRFPLPTCHFTCLSKVVRLALNRIHIRQVKVRAALSSQVIDKLFYQVTVSPKILLKPTPL